MDIYTQPDYKKSVLIIIDTQNDFSLPGAVLEVKGTYEIIPNITKILKMYRLLQLPIIHIVRLYQPDGSNVDIARREKIQNGLQAVIPGSEGAEIVDGLKPHGVQLDTELLLQGEMQKINENEYILYKPRWGAFYQTQLEKFLKDKKVSTLTFVGCNFPNCPRTSMYEASERDFKIVMIEDGISGVYEKGINEMENIGCTVISTERLIAQLQLYRV